MKPTERDHGDLLNRHLSDVMLLHTFSDVEEASRALHDGAVLLEVARCDNDQEGQPFRLLVGLPRETKITAFLSEIFGVPEHQHALRHIRTADPFRPSPTLAGFSS